MVGVRWGWGVYRHFASKIFNEYGFKSRSENEILLQKFINNS